MSQENGRDYFYYSANQHSIQIELMADLVCNFVRQRTEPDAGQGHAFSVFIKFFRLQLGVAGIPERFSDITDWYIGGHSLGGAMAASYAAKHTDELDGLVLLAAYSTADLTDSGLRVYSTYSSEDGVLNREKYEADRINLPQDTTETVIDGGCHAGFGSYGAQKGDGAPVISAEEQQQQTADALAAWMNLQ